MSVILTAAAFWLSYFHLHDVADGHGLQGATERAWAWPATIDLFIIVGELLILRASLRHTVDWWAIGLTVAGSGGSIALNVAGVGMDAAPLDYVVAAVPPVAALLAFGALMRQVHEHLAMRAATPSAAPVAPPARHTICAGPLGLLAMPALPSVQRLAEDVAEAMEPVLQDTEDVRLLTVADVAATKGVAEGTVRSWVNRNKLKPVGRDDDGRLQFHPATVAALD
ncbi:DUF2637 domain-containing protein [Streptomyces sp. NPDC087437]|uniref:DUF2637 domain-containing protein n=1 Tax=Streptomyces sp. NPDC087437 TaxID=3365789 RepID=UPI0038076AA2